MGGHLGRHSGQSHCTQQTIQPVLVGGNMQGNGIFHLKLPNKVSYNLIKQPLANHSNAS